MNNIRYASIREMDISNGENVGVALFTQGCPFNPHCYNCFNPETWDFNGGKEWTQEVENKFIELVSRPYIKRISILGGEPLADDSLDGVLHLVNKIRLLFPQKTIWLYSGYTWEEVFSQEECYKEIDKLIKSDRNLKTLSARYDNSNFMKRAKIIGQSDVFVDGRYINAKQDVALKWCGSSNQRCIDVQKSLHRNGVVLYCD